MPAVVELLKLQGLSYRVAYNNGLSQGVNNSIYRDTKGFVWISSFDGLNRFDGVSCITFRSTFNDPAGLKGTLFLNILEDKKSIRNGLPLSVEHLCMDEKKIWAATLDGLFLTDPVTTQITKLPLNNKGFGPASTRISAWMYCLSGDGSFLKCYDYKQMEYYIRCVKD